MGPLAWLGFAAFAARPMVLPISTGAQVRVLPRTDPEVVEVGVYENHAYAKDEVDGWRADGLRSARLDDIGGGIEFVVLRVVNPSLTVAVHPIDEHHVELRLVPGHPEVVAPHAAPTLEELLADPARRPAARPDRALLPLMRDARPYGLDPSTLRLEIPEEPLDPQVVALLGLEAEPTLEEIERYRQLLVRITDPEVLRELNRRLGAAHAALKMPREAVYYYERAIDLGVATPALELARADAAFRTRDWVTARDACEAAAALPDASAEEVLVCLGVLSEATLRPAPAETARALAQVAERRTARFLVGDLLLKDGYGDEALPWLQGAATDFRGQSQEVAWLAAGDAALIAGDLDAAQLAYHRARHGVLDPILTLRETVVAMSKDGARNWSAWVPELVDVAESGGVAAPDAWYLLSQVHARYGDAQSESDALVALWDLHPKGRTGADVGPRLVAACGDRLGVLARDGRDAELVETWSRCWRPGLLASVSDPTMLMQVADAFDHLGFTARALAVQQTLSETLALQGIEDFGSLARLAELQVVPVPEHALETSAYTRRFAKTDAERTRLRMVDAAALARLGRDAEALATWDAIRSPAAAADAARLAAAIHRLRSGSCAPAVATLVPRMTAAPLEGESPGDLELVVAHCLTELGDDAGAIRFAGLAVDRSEDPYVSREARWSATAIAMRTGLPLPPELTSDAGTFASLREEDAAQAAFQDRIDLWSHAP